MDLSKLSEQDLQFLAAGQMDKVSEPALQYLAAQSAPTAPRNNAADASNAVGTGFWKGMTRLAGLPVDTVANVRDLGKAALGVPYSAVTGKAPPDWLQVGDRANDIGSGDQLLKALGSTSAGKVMTQAQNPDYEGGYLQNAGAALTGVVNPTGLKNAVGQALRNITGAEAGKLAYDKTGNPALAVAAGMAPMLPSGSVRPAPTARDDAVAAAQKEGYVLPPSQAGAGWVNNRLESIAGKAALNQESILRNQPVTNKLAARAVGLAPEDLTVDNLAALRKDAGQRGYAPIDNIPRITATPEYTGSLMDIDQNIGNSFSPVAALRNPEVSKLMLDLNQPTMTGAEANALIKQLREAGHAKVNAAYGSADGQQTKALGKAMLGGATSIEDLITQNLMDQGPSNIVPQMQEARTLIAKSHDVGKALNPVTEDVNAGALARSYQKAQARGAPFDPNLAVAGDFASHFPQLTKPSSGVPTPGVSTLEALAVPTLAASGHLATGNLGGLLAGGLPLLRAPIRNMLLSKWYQRRYARPQDVSTGVDPDELGAIGRMMAATGQIDGSR